MAARILLESLPLLRYKGRTREDGEFRDTPPLANGQN